MGQIVTFFWGKPNT